MLQKIKKIFSNFFVLSIMFFIILGFVIGICYNKGLNPSNEKIQKIIDKFNIEDENNYKIPFYSAERYLTWYNMRTTFFLLHYILTLVSILSSLLVAFFASIKSNKDDDNNKLIVFLSLISVCFTVFNLFINANSMAYMSQHAWRSLDSCIVQTISNPNLSADEKNQIIADKIIEMEQYIESYEK